VPAFFGVAQPLLGDGWRYNVTLGPGWTFLGNDTVHAGNATAFAELHWTQSGTVRGGDGLMHDANRLQTGSLAYDPAGFSRDGYYDRAASEWVDLPPVDWMPTNARRLVLAGGFGIVQTGSTGSVNHTFTNYGLPFTGTGASVQRSTDTYGTIEFPIGQSPASR